MIAAIAALMILMSPEDAQTAAPGVVWSVPAPAEAETAPTAAPVALPDWAVADPFAWERSQCSPLVLKAGESVQTCQRRVRTDLAAVMGDDLPAGLQPSAVPECRSTGQDGDFSVTCAPEQRQTTASAPIQEQVCETRPQRQGSAVAWTSQCRPASHDADEGGLKINLFGDD